MNPRIPHGRLFVGAALLVLLSPWLRAEQIEVPGDFAGLQAAVDAADPGDVIMVYGGQHPPIVIDKELSIVGASGNTPVLRVELAPNPYELYPPVTLAGPGSGRVVLAGVELGGTAGSLAGNAPPAITGEGFDELWILHSSVTATEWVGPSGAGSAAAGIAVDVGHVLVVDSTIRGGHPVADSVWDDTYIYAGAAAISTTGDVSCFDSVVVGGDGLDGYMDTIILDPGGCGNLYGGTGGCAVVTPGTLYHANTWFAAGDGAEIRVYGPSGLEYVCHLPSGPALDAGAVEAFGTLMRPPAGGLGPGVTLTLQWDSPNASTSLVFGMDPSAPLSVGTAGLLYMNPSFMSLIWVPAVGTVTLPLSTSDPMLAGLPLAFQVYNPSVGLSRPVFAAFLP